MLAKVGVWAWRNSWLFRKAGTGASRVSGKGEERGVGLRTESKGPRHRPSGVPGKCSTSLGSGKVEEKKWCQYVSAGGMGPQQLPFLARVSMDLVGALWGHGVKT